MPGCMLRESAAATITTVDYLLLLFYEHYFIGIDKCLPANMLIKIRVPRHVPM